MCVVKQDHRDTTIARARHSTYTTVQQWYSQYVCVGYMCGGFGWGGVYNHGDGDCSLYL